MPEVFSTPRFSFKPQGAVDFLAVVHGMDVWRTSDGGVVRTIGWDLTSHHSLASLEIMRGSVAWADEILALLWRRPEPQAPIEIVVERKVYVTGYTTNGRRVVTSDHHERILGYTRPQGYTITLSNDTAVHVDGPMPEGMIEAVHKYARFELVLREVR